MATFLILLRCPVCTVLSLLCYKSLSILVSILFDQDRERARCLVKSFKHRTRQNSHVSTLHNLAYCTRITMICSVRTRHRQQQQQQLRGARHEGGEQIYGPEQVDG